MPGQHSRWISTSTVSLFTRPYLIFDGVVMLWASVRDRRRPRPLMAQPSQHRLEEYANRSELRRRVGPVFSVYQVAAPT